MDIKLRVYAYLFASLLIGAFTPVLLAFTKGTNAFELFFLASFFSIPVGLALVVKSGKAASLRKFVSDRSKLFYAVLAGLLMYIPYEYGIAYAEKSISASLTIVLFRLNPLLMLIFLPILLREKLSRKQIVALCLGFLGIFIGLSQGNFTDILSTPNMPIIALVILFAIGYALANVIIKWKMIDSDIFLSVSGFALCAFFGLAFLIGGAQFAPLSGLDIGIIIYIAITNIFSFYMYLYALKRLKTTLVTNVLMSSTFFSLIFSYFLLGEQIQLYYLAIAVLVIIGMLVQRNDKEGGSYLTKDNKKHTFTIFDVTGVFANSKIQTINNVIESGGRVFATKIDKASSQSVHATISDQKFMNVYTGEEGLLSSEYGFVKDVIGAKPEDMVIIKAGTHLDNEAFFDELNRWLS